MDFPEDLAETVERSLDKLAAPSADNVYDAFAICEDIHAIYPDLSREVIGAAIRHFGAKRGIRVIGT